MPLYLTLFLLYAPPPKPLTLLISLFLSVSLSIWLSSEYSVISFILIEFYVSPSILNKTEALNGNWRGELNCIGKFVKPDALEAGRCAVEGKIMEKQVPSSYQGRIMGKRTPNNTDGLSRPYIQQGTERVNK